MVRTPIHTATAGGQLRRPQFMVTMTPGGVWCLHGELDLATAPQLQECLQTGRPTNAAQLVVDLSDLTFSSCAGLTVLLAEHHRRQAAGARLVLTAPNGALRRILFLTGLDTVLNIWPARPDQPLPRPTVASAAITEPPPGQVHPDARAVAGHFITEPSLGRAAAACKCAGSAATSPVAMVAGDPKNHG